jgi:hypothetical protein
MAMLIPLIANAGAASTAATAAEAASVALTSQVSVAALTAGQTGIMATTMQSMAAANVATTAAAATEAASAVMTTAEVAMAYTQVAMGGIGALGAVQKSKHDTKMLESKAKQAEADALTSKSVGAARVLKLREAENLLESSRNAGAGMRGVDTTVGSGVSIDRQAAETHDFNMAFAKSSARQEELGHYTRAANIRLQKRQAQQQGRDGVISSLGLGMK